jgi:septal ring factor EnvC (AmiA/AmiB activator)
MSKVFSIILFLFICYVSFSQDISNLEKKKSKTLEQIAYTNKILNDVRLNKKQTINKLQLIQKRVNLSKELINDINQEISSLDSKLKEKEAVINMMEEDLIKIKKEYADLLVYTYKANRNQEKLMFIFSSDNFNQVYKRIKYLKILSEHRKNQAEIISEISFIVSKEKKTLESQIDKLELLVDEKENERRILASESKKEEVLIGNLKKKEIQLLRKIRENKQIANKLENEIEKLIAEEAKKTGTATYQLTPEEKIISQEFDKNLGKLPWPTQRGIISNYFGKHKHPVLKGIYIENNGIDITTSRGEQVRAVFDGKVSKIIAIKGANYTIIVRHGNFLSVYQNVVNVRVRVGQKVKTKEIIGDVFYDATEGTAILHFEIWKELEKQNPQLWISGK